MSHNLMAGAHSFCSHVATSSQTLMILGALKAHDQRAFNAPKIINFGEDLATGELFTSGQGKSLMQSQDGA